MSRPMKDSGVEWIGQIPESWTVVRFKDVLYKKKEICKSYTDEDIISLTMRGVIVRDLINPTGKMPATFDGYQYVEKGNLLLCLFDIDVTPRCVGIVKNNGLTSPAYSRYILRNQESLEYYNFLLTYLDDKKILLSFAKSLRNTLTDEYFGAVKTLLPPIREQQKIAKFLDGKTAQIDSIIADTKQSVIEFKKYKQALITETVTKGINPDVKMKDSKIEWVGEIPEHWEITKFKYEIYTRGRLGWKGLTADEYVNEGKIFLATPNIKGYEIDFTNVNYITDERYQESPEIMLSEGDVLLTKDGSTLGTVNVIRFLPKEATVNSSIAVLTPSENLHSLYLYNYIKSSYIQNLINRKKDGMGVPHLFQKDIREFNLLLPEIQEQQQIANYLDEKCTHIDSLIADKEQLIREFEDYKKALIFEYVTGKKEVE